MKLESLIFSLLSALTSVNCFADSVFDSILLQVSPEDKFVFYSHGYIVEGDNPKPVETKNGWGEYDFPAIKKALADDSYTLVAHHRAKNTDPFEYAYELNKQVRTLVKKGVKPEYITLVGFSRGAFITGLASDKLSDLGVNTVILAGCGRLVWKKHTDIKVYGHVLSVYESSDKAQSCAALDKKSTQTRSFNEIEINTGLSHGAFYRPLKVWVEPVKRWIKSNKK
ncbi:alpha/beta hydrolase [Pseudoalteromonas sp. JBTF-M23]|uniref:Alpha/beta hydrolase n=1 Tax=Pseudoalteromonas caenipelagi TaxID=2726988 RepID=A0A849VFB7_9GAMM|nr:alpha/beta hydrolase [Pseudoalteromonas caenipelagi]NOU51448.1 alpha/beta hydrolase [Pseudoalteromonas caenipelagi]